jgi:hypothetical protein
MLSKEWKNRVETKQWKDFPNFATPAESLLGLQDHGKRVYFRYIKIKEL